MTELDRWFNSFTSTPVGSVLLFLLVFASRVAIDQWSRKRDERKKKKRKGHAHG